MWLFMAMFLLAQALAGVHAASHVFHTHDGKCLIYSVAEHGSPELPAAPLVATSDHAAARVMPLSSTTRQTSTASPYLTRAPPVTTC